MAYPFRSNEIHIAEVIHDCTYFELIKVKNYTFFINFDSRGTKNFDKLKMCHV